MKICFLCGSVEPGKNGVGDYARRLAGEMIRSGHEACLIGINESGLSQPTVEAQDDSGTPVYAHRWPADMSWHKRFADLERLLREISPTHLSVQFVLYAFDRHGLPYQFVRRFQKLPTSAQLHFTIHELWYESEKMGSKQRIVSFLQSRLTLGFLKAATPAIMHMSLPSCQQALARMQLPVLPLPIFSNIEPLEPDAAMGPATTTENETIRAAFFSQCSIHPDVGNFIEAFQSDCQAQGKQLAITFIGGSESHARTAIQQLRIRMGDTFEMEYTGKLSPGDISRKLQEIDFGISPVPRHVIGKSGSTAAFLTHGKAVAIPHIEPGESPDHIGFAIEELRPAFLTTPAISAMERATLVAQQESHRISLQHVTAQLIEDLQASPDSLKK